MLNLPLLLFRWKLHKEMDRQAKLTIKLFLNAALPKNFEKINSPQKYVNLDRIKWKLILEEDFPNIWETEQIFINCKWISSSLCTLQRTYLCIPFLGIVRPQSQFPHSCVCERFKIPSIGPHFSCSRIGRPIMGIYKSLTDTWMWKLGLRPHNSFSGKICFECSALCLCSAVTQHRISSNM